MVIRIGDQVPILFQADDGNVQLTVKAKIYDGSNKILQEVTLSHVGHGLYVYDQFLMPDTYYLTVQYFPSDLDLYGVPVDTFRRELPDLSEGYAVGIVVKTMNKDEYAIGVVQ